MQQPKGSLHIWHCSVPASWLHLEMHDFALGVKKSEIRIIIIKKTSDVGEGKDESIILHLSWPLLA